MIPDSRVTLIALRDEGDDYDQRAWCIAESVLALTFNDERRWADTFPLRLNLSKSSQDMEPAPLRKLHCSEPEDLVPASLLTLAGLDWERLNRGSEARTEPDLWIQALHRFRDGGSLVARVVVPGAPDEKRLPRVRFVEAD